MAKRGALPLKVTMQPTSLSGVRMTGGASIETRRLQGMTYDAYRVSFVPTKRGRWKIVMRVKTNDPDHRLIPLIIVGSTE